MSSASDDTKDLAALGRAIATLRDAKGMTQDDAAALYSEIFGPNELNPTAPVKKGDTLSGQAWGAYELGDRVGLRKPSMQARFARTLGVSVEALKYEAAKIDGATAGSPSASEGLTERQTRSFEPQTTGNTRRLVLTDDTLDPWAASGTTAVYSLDEWPRAGEGVALEPLDGSPTFVKLYVRADANTLTVAEIWPERREITLPRKEYAAYRVTARLS